MNGADLNRSADIGTIRKLHRDGLLSDDAFSAASAVLRPVSVWFSWARRMLLLLGSTLVLAGVIFFFAYNWAEMGRFLKFGLIEAGIVACIVASHLLRRSPLIGKILLLSASILVGVLLAVYGQTYQTGADAFELFVGWSVLILGWVVVSQFAALWVTWLVIVNTAVILYWEQVGAPAHSIRYELLCLAVACLNGAVLVAREVGVRKRLEWLSGVWLRGVLLAAPLVALSFPMINLIVDLDDAESLTALGALAWIVAVVGGYACYRFVLRDMVALALIVLNACVILLTLIGRVLFHKSSSEEITFLLFGVIILGVVSAAGFWLRKTAAAIAGEMKESAE